MAGRKTAGKSRKLTFHLGYFYGADQDDLINYVWDDENVLQEMEGNTGEIKAHYTDYPGWYWHLFC
jgi:hypothetical protein